MDVSAEDRIALTCGLDFWHTQPLPEADLPSIMVADGPHGLRRQESSDGLGEAIPATCFPPAVGLASTWDRSLAAEVGTALGIEANALGVGVILGPGINIKRDPRCGRNFEYLSEDPTLAGELAAALVQGIQSQGVGTSVKHFAANNQETDRMRRDSQVDERTLREIYLKAFQTVVTRSQPWTVMCSYNALNGVKVAENRWLLTDLLRGEWGFEGVVVSDWGAVWDRAASLEAGLDLEMPGNRRHQDEAVAAYRAGDLGDDAINTSFARMSELVRKAVAGRRPDAGFDAEAHHALARRAAEEAIVLLDNDGVLPLHLRDDVSVIGEFAAVPRYQGAGSSRVNPTRLDNALDAIRQIIGREVAYEPGFAAHPGSQIGPEAHDRAVELARAGGIVLLFLGLGESHESEGFDRATLELPAEQLALLDDILEVNPNVVVVLSNGSAVTVDFRHRVRAVVEGWLLGQAGGSALADVLFGRVNPSGRLAETIPARLADVPSYLSFPGDGSGVRYAEGLFVGYRGYDARQQEVAYPFGHGLSYTAFDHDQIRGRVQDDTLVVEALITNTGERAGREVVQVYVGKPDSGVVGAVRELKGFTGVTLDVGESASVQVRIPLAELAYWSVLNSAWVVEGGDYLIEVGASSRDLRGSATVTIEGTQPPAALTMASTCREALADPVASDFVRALMKRGFGDDDVLGVDTTEMMGDVPLNALIGFAAATDEELVQLSALLDERTQQ